MIGHSQDGEGAKGSQSVPITLFGSHSPVERVNIVPNIEKQSALSLPSRKSEGPCCPVQIRKCLWRDMAIISTQIAIINGPSLPLVLAGYMCYFFN